MSRTHTGVHAPARRRRPAPRRRSIGAEAVQAHPPGRSPRWLEPAPVLAVLWIAVIGLWAGGVLRAPTSVVFLFAAAGAVAHIVSSLSAEAPEHDRWHTARLALVLALLVAVPVAFDPRTLDMFNVTKYGIVVVAGIAVVALLLIEGLRRRAVPSWRNGLQWPVLALLAVTAASTAASGSLPRTLLGDYASYDGLYATAAFVAVFFAVSEAVTSEGLRRAFGVMFFGGAGLVALFGLFQLHDRLWEGARWDWAFGGPAAAGFKVFSTFGNPNHLAGYIASILPIGIVVLLVKQGWRQRGLAAAIIVALLVQLVYAASRGGWVAAAVALGLLVVFLLPDIRRRLGVTFVVATAVVVVVAASFLVLVRSSDVADKLSSTLAFTGKNTTVQRLAYWKAAVEMGGERPLVGVGPDQFKRFFPSYQTRDFVDDFGPRLNVNGPHNTFLNYLATLGFPGLGAFVAILSVAALRLIGAWRRFRRVEREGDDGERERAREQRWLLSAIGAGLAGYVVQASFNVQQIGLSFVFWTLLGLLCVATRRAGVPDTLRPGRLLASRSTESAPSGAVARRDEPVERGRLAPTGVPTAALVAVALLAHPATAPWRADHSFAESLGDEELARARASSDPADAQSFNFRSIEKLLDAISTNPWEPRYLVAAGYRAFRNAESKSGSPEELAPLRKAREHFGRAVAVDPRHAPVLASYASVLARLYHLEPADDSLRREALDVVRRARRLNPYDAEVAASLRAIEADLANSSRAGGSRPAAGSPEDRPAARG